MKRGEVWVGNMNPARGAEVGKSRPVLVMQADQLMDQLGTVVVLPLTSQSSHELGLIRIPIPARERLDDDSFVLVEQPRSLDKRKFGEGPLTRLTEDEMLRVEKGFKIALSLY